MLIVQTPALAQSSGESMNLIRDAEIESDLRQMIFPILNQAGLDPASFRLYIIQNKDLNAFVAGGQNIFLHTGLLIRSDNYAQLMGVIAHEAGHIAGGHLARSKETLQDIGRETLLLQALAAAAMALGQGQAGAAVLSAGAQLFQRQALAYTRTQERSADQAGLKFLTGLGVSPQGLLDFFKILQSEQKILIDKANPYTQTHPLTNERIEAIAAYLNDRPDLRTKGLDDKNLAEAHRRIRAKLIGFMLPPQQVEKYYPVSDQSFAANYARAIMDYRRGELQQSLATIASLIQQEPKNPYLYELRGQVYRESASSDFGSDTYIPAYEKSVELAPQEPLLRLGLVQALLDRSSDKDVQLALAHLQEVLRLESRYGLAWQMESIAQGKAGHIGKSALALSELALLRGDKKRAKDQAERATKLLKDDPIAQQRAEDIKNQIQIEEKDKK